jgi:hypothetical protein
VVWIPTMTQGLQRFRLLKGLYGALTSF